MVFSRDIFGVNTFLSEASMFCASYMKRGEEAVDHSRCNDFECQANQIDSNNYKTRHRTEDCNCEFYNVDEGKLQQIIRDERIPYIEMKPVKLEDETKTLQVELQSHKDSVIEYSRSIAIFSHVWSDGMSNCRRHPEFRNNEAQDLETRKATHSPCASCSTSTISYETRRGGM